MNTTKTSLPLLAPAADQPPQWHGWTPITAIEDFKDAESAPLPLEPQGAYGDGAEEPLTLPALGAGKAGAPTELLAPAGGPEAAWAALHFGADAIYLGLQKFSARAEAENFTLEQVDEITAYAHALTPPRRVFVTINTLIRQDELPELVEDIARLDALGVDAIILQDVGAYHLLRTYFPALELHASTQLAVHNRAGAEALKALGFHRVVLARELTFEEVHDITQTAGIETEVFIHGALCYSYSGLCLFSSQTLGRSGNRGKCAYSCRDAFAVEGAPLELRDGSAVHRDPRAGFPFSMKDLALPDHLPALQAAGVSCFKIEGRKKSPLYVATTTDYYRRLMDGRLDAEDRPDIEADLQTVFSRPWTRLFVQSHKDKEVADRDTVGHRGTVIGKVQAVVAPATVEARLRFKTRRPLQRHDGLQIDLPTQGKPFGFAVERLWIVEPTRHSQRREEFSAPAGSLIEVSLPREHPPLPPGAPVYCSSSQAVKQKYRHDKPKPGQHRSRRLLDIELTLTGDALVAVGTLVPHRGAMPEAVVRQTLAGPFERAKDASALLDAARNTFAKLGQTRFELRNFVLHNKASLFVPVSRLNQLRRDVTTALEKATQDLLAARIAEVQAATCGNSQPVRAQGGFRWSIKVDRSGYLEAFTATDLADIDEIVIDIARDHPALLQEKLETLAGMTGRERIRLSLPPLTRRWEEKGLRHKIAQLCAAGWNKWEAGNLSAWKFLETPERLDLATDWSIYVLNRLAARELLAWGVRRFALSPEDGSANIASLLAEFAEQAVVIVYQDTPLFLAESCAYANLIGGCPGKANCKFESMNMVSSHGEKVTALDYHCRTIVLNQGPFCLSPRLAELAHLGARNLRADFVYRPYQPEEVRERWRLVRSGRVVPGGHAANFDRGVL